MRTASLLLLVLGLLLPARTSAAQTQPRPSPVPRDPGAFLLEAGAGTLGSLAGMGIVALVSACGYEDLGCTIRTVGAGGAAGALGATLGVTLAARATGAPRSTAGAALGAIAGTGIGLGVHWLLNRASDRNLGDTVVVPIFAISQGVFAAIGSRIGGRR